MNKGFFRAAAVSQSLAQVCHIFFVKSGLYPPNSQSQPRDNRAKPTHRAAHCGHRGTRGGGRWPRPDRSPAAGARRGQRGAPAHKAPQRARLTARRDPRAAPRAPPRPRKIKKELHPSSKEYRRSSSRAGLSAPHRAGRAAARRRRHRGRGGREGEGGKGAAAAAPGDGPGPPQGRAGRGGAALTAPSPLRADRGCGEAAGAARAPRCAHAPGKGGPPHPRSPIAAPVPGPTSVLPGRRLRAVRRERRCPKPRAALRELRVPRPARSGAGGAGGGDSAGGAPAPRPCPAAALQRGGLGTARSPHRPRRILTCSGSCSSCCSCCCCSGLPCAHARSSPSTGPRSQPPVGVIQPLPAPLPFSYIYLVIGSLQPPRSSSSDTLSYRKDNVGSPPASISSSAALPPAALSFLVENPSRV